MVKFDEKTPAASRRKGIGILTGCLAAFVVLAAALTVFLSGKTPDIQETVPREEQEQTVQTQPAVSDDAATEPAQTQPLRRELALESVAQEDQMMVVTTSYCVLEYPFAFSDLIRVTAENQEDQAVLLFCAWLNNTEYPMFSIVFDGNGEIPVGTLKLDDGTVVSVTAQFFQADEAMEPDMLQSFYAVQETFNDIIRSLAENEHFDPAV